MANGDVLLLIAAANIMQECRIGEYVQPGAFYTADVKCKGMHSFDVRPVMGRSGIGKVLSRPQCNNGFDVFAHNRDKIAFFIRFVRLRAASKRNA